MCTPEIQYNTIQYNNLLNSPQRGKQCKGLKNYNAEYVYDFFSKTARIEALLPGYLVKLKLTLQSM